MMSGADKRPVVRLATSSDLPAIAAIESAVFADPWSRRSLATAIAAPGHICLALDSETGTLAGYALGRVMADEGEVLNIAIDGARRRRGYGRLLLASLLESLGVLGAETVYLEVRASNRAALALYGRLGFRSAGRREGYYSEPREDAVTMVWDGPPGRHKYGEVPHEIG